jgi:predicted short-subunit dehydrogenase-like oxidoreductase (DUF2520 family)
MKTLNIIGAGRVGRTLARLWRKKHIFGVHGVLTATVDGGRDAVALIGAGRPVARLADMRPADVWMVTVPDSAIRACGEALAASGLLRSGDVVFHCSGALSSAELESAAERSASTASVHPLKSFAHAQAAIRTFADTHCAAEGAPAALALLRPAFEGIGAKVFEIDPERKTVYHAASVIVCNYLTALMETGLRCFERAGFARETALPMMEPLVRETLDNVFALGTVRALTGPIARGDDEVVARQLAALAHWDAGIATLYRDLGAIAIELAQGQGKGDPAALERLRALLGRRE